MTSKSSEVESLTKKLDAEVAAGGDVEKMLRMIYEETTSISDATKRRIRRQYELPSYKTIKKAVNENDSTPANPSVAMFFKLRKDHGEEGLVNILMGRPPKPTPGPKKRR